VTVAAAAAAAGAAVHEAVEASMLLLLLLLLLLLPVRLRCVSTSPSWVRLGSACSSGPGCRRGARCARQPVAAQTREGRMAGSLATAASPAVQHSRVAGTHHVQQVRMRSDEIHAVSGALSCSSVHYASAIELAAAVLLLCCQCAGAV
jgi:hypothetical protein